MEIKNQMELIKCIETAFQFTPYPSKDELGGEMKVLEDYNWKNLPISIISKYKDSFHRLGADSFRYFVPALMIAVILEPDETDTLVTNLIHLLTPEMDRLVVTKVFLHRIQAIDKQEGKAIAMFLSYCYEPELSDEPIFVTRETEILETALEYWSQYLPEE